MLLEEGDLILVNHSSMPAYQNYLYRIEELSVSQDHRVSIIARLYSDVQYPEQPVAKTVPLIRSNAWQTTTLPAINNLVVTRLPNAGNTARIQFRFPSAIDEPYVRVFARRRDPVTGEFIDAALVDTGLILYPDASNNGAVEIPGLVTGSIVELVPFTSTGLRGQSVTAAIPRLTTDTIALTRIENIDTDRLIGRDTAGTGSPEVITLSQALDFVGSAAQGDLLYRGASTWTRLAAGTRGRYLQTAGASADPSWASSVVFRNVLINGDMRVSQRGTSFTNATLVTNVNRGYTLDRWFIQSEGPSATFAGDIINVNQSTNAPAEAAGLFESRINSIELDPVTGITTRKFGIAQIVEQRNCRHLRGATASLSFKARVSATSIGDVRAVVLAWTGTADGTAATNLLSSWGAGAALPTWVSTMTQCNVNANPSYTPPNLNVTSSWATYRIENISIPNTMNNLVVFIWNNDRDYSAADSLFITDVQLEPGSVATEFEYLPYEVQEERCARYLPRGVVGPLEHFFGGGNPFIREPTPPNGNGAFSAPVILINFSTRARVRPTGVTWTPSHFQMYSLVEGQAGFFDATEISSANHGYINSVLRIRCLVTPPSTYASFQPGSVVFLVQNNATLDRPMLFTGCEL
jgi:hypothetical protein